MSNPKNYVLDTNVLLHDPNALTSFRDNHVVVPLIVIKELEKHKRDNNELGRNAREVCRQIDALRKSGQINAGVKLQNGGTLQILVQPNNGSKRKKRHSNGNDAPNNDDIIIAEASRMRDTFPNILTVLVTKDVAMRIIADAKGLRVEDYETDRVQTEKKSDIFEITVEPNVFKTFSEGSGLDLETSRQINTYGTLSCIQSGKQQKRSTLLVRVDGSGRKIVPIIDSRDGVTGIKPRNMRQHFALDALLRDEVKLVTLEGKAGTGKTLLTMAAGLKMVEEDRAFRRLVVARPTVSVGKEIGFLPGTLEEKLDPWMQPIHDALEYITDSSMGSGRRKLDLIKSGSVIIEALCYIRGRSIANQFLIIDEAQNLTPLEVKTIITRVSHGTKIVFTGDPQQIDNPYVDSQSNGFVHLVNSFAGKEIATHVLLDKGERSELAELAANIL